MVIAAVGRRTRSTSNASAPFHQTPDDLGLHRTHRHDNRHIPGSHFSTRTFKLFHQEANFQKGENICAIEYLEFISTTTQTINHRRKEGKRLSSLLLRRTTAVSASTLRRVSEHLWFSNESRPRHEHSQSNVCPPPRIRSSTRTASAEDLGLLSF